jgi:Tfp pilus assembly protein PilO
MKLTKRESTIFYISLSLLLFFILERLVFRQLANRLSSLSQEIQATETKLARGLRAQRQKDAILKEYKTFEDFLKLNGSDEEIVSAFLREIEKLSRDAGISITDIKPRSTKRVGLYKEYIIEVRLDATFKDLVKFLYRLNDSNFLIRVDKLSLNLTDEKSEILKISMVINGIAL